MAADLRVRRLDPRESAPVDSRRSEQLERLSQGTEAGTPGKAVRPPGRTCEYGREAQLAVLVGKLGKPQSPTKGYYRQETETAA